ncbi:PEPxxWA-CTERM sorting domain-containing protein [Sphingomonas daechungensis]|uniref:PEPxxWA-CTERM sorting domain-containing protein n=1 Tax=Sphingomonas daechungensis TaxID=1176646 RepID=UPI003782FDE9
MTKRRNRTILASAAVLAIVAGTPLGIMARMGLLDSSDVPGLDSAKSFLAMMSERSPGDRAKAELTKTKMHAAVAAPRQRALPKVAQPELPKEFVAAIAPPVPTVADVPTSAPLSSIGPLLLTPGVPGGGGGILVPNPPGGGGGTPGTPGTPETPPENPPPENPPPENPPPAVPEPGTWATMLLGFGLTGMMIRRRRRTTTAIASA